MTGVGCVGAEGRIAENRLGQAHDGAGERRRQVAVHGQHRRDRSGLQDRLNDLVRDRRGRPDRQPSRRHGRDEEGDEPPARRAERPHGTDRGPLPPTVHRARFADQQHEHDQYLPHTTTRQPADLFELTEQRTIQPSSNGTRTSCLHHFPTRAWPTTRSASRHAWPAPIRTSSS